MRNILAVIVLLLLIPRLLPADNDPAAVEFLRSVQQANEELQTLRAKFDQTRIDLTFGDSIESKGEFWYRAPDLFRASYDAEHSSEIWMMDGQLISYVPANEQVEIIKLKQGEDAPINQLLLGFGVQVDKILEIFDVRLLESEDDDIASVEFVSKDLARSLEYETITIDFDREDKEPRALKLFQLDNEVTVELKSVKINDDIDDDVFKTNWPDDAEVVTYRQSDATE